MLHFFLTVVYTIAERTSNVVLEDARAPGTKRRLAMKLFQAAAVALLTSGSLSAGSAPTTIPDVSGIWKSLSADDRLMTITLREDNKITIEARDLACTMSDLQPQTDALLMAPPSVTANSVCYDESDTIYARDTLTVLRVGQDVFLIEATIPTRHVNETSDPKIDEAFTNQSAVVTIYRKVGSK